MPKPSLDEIFSSGPSTAPGQKPSLDEIFGSNVKPGAPSVQSSFEKAHPTMAAIEKVAGAPARFASEMALGWPMYAAKKAGMTFPEDNANKAPNFAAQVGGFAFNPIMQTVGKVNPVAGLGWTAALHAPSDEAKTALEMAKEKAIEVPVSMALPSAIDKTLKGIGNIPNAVGGVSSRIHNMMVKLPTKAFNYSKDPLDVLKLEKLPGKTLTDYANNAEQRLSQRRGELDKAVSNSNKTVNVLEMMDNHIKDAVKSAKGSLQDRTAILDKLDYMKKALVKQYGDLSKIPVQKAVKLYRQLADDFPFSGNTEENIMAKTAHKMYHDIGAAVDQAHPEIADLNHRVSGLIDITKAVNNRVAIESKNNPIGLIGTIIGAGVAGGVGGAATGHNPLQSGVETAIAFKALSSPFVLTKVANTLARMSEVDRAAVMKAYPSLVEKIKGMLPKAPAQTDTKIFEDLTAMRGYRSTSPTGNDFNPVGGINKDPMLDELWQRKAQGETGSQDILNNPVHDFNPIKKQGSGTSLANKKGSISFGDDFRGKPKEELEQELKKYENVVSWSRGQADKSQLRDAETMVNKIKNAIKDVGRSPMGLAIGAGTGVVAGASLAQASTLGQKNNNPINLKAFDKWDGMTGKDSFGHAQFKDLDHGIRASLRNLENHKAKHPTQSIESYMKTFAETNGDKEAKYISEKLGVTSKTSLSNVDMKQFLIHLSKFESKMDITAQDLERVSKKFNLK